MAQRLKTPAELAEIERRRKETRAAVPDPTVRLMREIGSIKGHRSSAPVNLQRLEAMVTREEFWRVLLSADLERRLVILRTFAGTWAYLTWKEWEDRRPY